MPLDSTDRQFILDLEKRVKKLEDRVKSDEKHVDKKLKPKKKKLPKAFGPEKAAKHADYLKRWDDHDRLFNEAKAKFEGGRFLPGTNDELIAARRLLRKEGRKFRTRKDEEAIGPDEIRDAKRGEDPFTGGSIPEDRHVMEHARYGVRPPVRASALGASVGSGLRYGRRF
jgi:hypothetical protein